MNATTLLQAHHASTADTMERTADESYPTTAISELMQSPCRPEEDGYFGATYGVPSKLVYEFEMEAMRGSKEEEALLVIEEHLMDMVLAVTFPTICSFKGDGLPPAKKTQDVVITGFKFGREKLDMERECSPTVGRTNYCNSFSGELHIFGNDVENTVSYAKSVINYAIEGSLPQVLNYGVQRVETVHIMSSNPTVDNGVSEILPLPLPILYGIIVSGACIIFGAVLLYFYLKKDKIRFHRLQEEQRKLMGSMSGSFHYLKPNGRHVGDTENGSLTSEISSVQTDFENVKVSKIPNDDIKIVSFDPDYASSCGLVSERSTSSRPSSRSSSSRSRQPSETMSHPPHYLDEKGRFSYH